MESVESVEDESQLLDLAVKCELENLDADFLKRMNDLQIYWSMLPDKESPEFMKQVSSSPYSARLSRIMRARHGNRKREMDIFIVLLLRSKLILQLDNVILEDEEQEKQRSIKIELLEGMLPGFITRFYGYCYYSSHHDKAAVRKELRYNSSSQDDMIAIKVALMDNLEKLSLSSYILQTSSTDVGSTMREIRNLNSQMTIANTVFKVLQKTIQNERSMLKMLLGIYVAFLVALTCRRLHIKSVLIKPIAYLFRMSKYLLWRPIIFGFNTVMRLYNTNNHLNSVVLTNMENTVE